MNIYTTSKENIVFTPETIIDGMKIGIITEKLKKINTKYTLEFNTENSEILERLIISQKDLVDLLC